MSHCIVLRKKQNFWKDHSDNDVANGLEASMILIPNSALTLDFPSCDALAIRFSSAFSLSAYSQLRPAHSPTQSGYATDTGSKTP